MSRRFFELGIRACRFVTNSGSSSVTSRNVPAVAPRQSGGELTRFSFRLAFVIDLTYVGLGALGGAAVGRTVSPKPISPACARDSVADVPNAAAHSNPRLRFPVDPPSRAMR